AESSGIHRPKSGSKPLRTRPSLPFLLKRARRFRQPLQCRHRLLGLENVRATLKAVHAFLEPGIAERKSLMTGKAAMQWKRRGRKIVQESVQGLTSFALDIVYRIPHLSIFRYIQRHKFRFSILDAYARGILYFRCGFHFRRREQIQWHRLR